MRFLSRSGAANASTIILSSGVLILCLAAAYYLVAVVPMQTADEMSGSSSSSSSSSSITTTPPPTGGPDALQASSRPRTPQEQAAYEGCINAATAAHNSRWAASCEERKNAQESAYLACLQERQDETYCTAQFGGYEDIGATCNLGTARSNALNFQYAAAKLACGL